MARKSVGDKKAGKTKAAGKTTRGITSEDALAFIRKMQKRFPKPPRTRAEKARLQKYLSKFTDGLLKAVGLRVQSDLMLRPPRTVRREDFETPAARYRDGKGKKKQ